MNWKMVIKLVFLPVGAEERFMSTECEALPIKEKLHMILSIVYSLQSYKIDKKKNKEYCPCLEQEAKGGFQVFC